MPWRWRKREFVGAAGRFWVPSSGSWLEQIDPQLSVGRFKC